MTVFTQTGGQSQSRLSVLQMGDLAFQLIAVGVGETGVGEAGVGVLVQIHGGIEVFQHIGGGLIDGGAQGARRVFHVAGVDLTRGKTELFLRVHTVDLPFFTGPSGDAPQGQN